MVVHSISIPLSSADMALRYRQHRDEERRLFSDRSAVRSSDCSLKRPLLSTGYSAAEVVADSAEDSERACGAVHTAYNRVIPAVEARLSGNARKLALGIPTRWAVPSRAGGGRSSPDYAEQNWRSWLGHLVFPLSIRRPPAIPKVTAALLPARPARSRPSLRPERAPG
jgi:hypothetical protein